MNLQELLSGVALTECRAAGDVEITGISYDTRDLKPGALFAALSGYKTDGHRYIREALEKGAAAVLCQRAPDFDGPWLVAGDTRAALADVSANWFGRPAEAMTCVGVTGTNGKTTTTYLLKAALEGALKAKVGLIGTNQNMIGEEILPAHRTTPESYELQALLRQMADAGCTHVVMEVSSHALVLHRVRGIRFAAGIFTNLTQDHLDFHGTMEAYRAAKGCSSSPTWPFSTWTTRPGGITPGPRPARCLPTPSGRTRPTWWPRISGYSPAMWNLRRWPRGPSVGCFSPFRADSPSTTPWV